MNRRVCGYFFAAALCAGNDARATSAAQAPPPAASRTTPPAHAADENEQWQPRSTLDQINSVIAVSSATLRTFARNADARLLQQKLEIDRLTRRLASAGNDAAELDRIRGQLAAREGEFIAELARRDDDYARLVAAFRERAAPIAADPTRAPYLALYREGRLDEAFDGLDRQEQINDRKRRDAYDKRADIERAMEIRQNAELAFLALGGGDVTTASVAARYRRAIALDPTSSDWLRLATLQLRMAELDTALHAVQKSLALARDPVERIATLSVEADVHAALGNRKAQWQAIEQRVRLSREQTVANPADAPARRELFAALLASMRYSGEEADADIVRKTFSEALGVAGRGLRGTPDYTARAEYLAELLMMGAVVEAVSSPADALAIHERALPLATEAAASNPDDGEAQRVLASLLAAQGRLTAASGQAATGISTLQRALDTMQALLKRDSSNVRAQRGVGDIYADLGRSMAKTGQLDASVTAYRSGLQVWNDIANADADDAVAWLRTAQLWRELGMTLRQQAANSKAEEAYLRSLSISTRLAASAPKSAPVQQELLQIHAQLFKLYRDEDRQQESEAQRRSADAVIARADREKLHLPTRARNVLRSVDATSRDEHSGGSVSGDGYGFSPGQIRRGVLTPASTDVRLRLSATLRLAQKDMIVRQALFDITLPKDAQEYRALDGYGVIVVTSLTKNAAELPLKRVYVRVDGKDIDLRLLHSSARTLDEASNEALVYGKHRWDGCYLFPIYVQKQDGEILVDFAVNRVGMAIASFKGHSSHALRQLPSDRPLGRAPSADALRRLIQRELPDLGIPLDKLPRD